MTIDYKFSDNIYLRLRSTLGAYLILSKKHGIINANVEKIIKYLYGLIGEVESCGTLSLYNVQNINVLLAAARVGYFGEPLEYFNTENVDLGHINLEIIEQYESEYSGRLGTIDFYMDPTIKYVLFQATPKSECGSLVSSPRREEIKNTNMIIEWPSTFSAYHDFINKYKQFIKLIDRIPEMNADDLERMMGGISPSVHFATIFAAYKRIFHKTLTDIDTRNLNDALRTSVGKTTHDEDHIEMLRLEVARLKHNLDTQSKVNEKNMQDLVNQSIGIKDEKELMKMLEKYGGPKSLRYVLNHIQESVGKVNIDEHFDNMEHNLEIAGVDIATLEVKIIGLERELQNAHNEIDLMSLASNTQDNADKVIAKLRDEINYIKTQSDANQEINDAIVKELKNTIEVLKVDSDEFIKIREFAVTLNNGSPIMNVKDFLAVYVENLVYNLGNASYKTMFLDKLLELLYGTSDVMQSEIETDFKEIQQTLSRTTSTDSIIKQIKMHISGTAKWQGLISHIYSVIKDIEHPSLLELRKLIEANNGYAQGYLLDGVSISTHVQLVEEYKNLERRLVACELKYKSLVIGVGDGDTLMENDAH